MDEIVKISENGIFEKILNGNVMDLGYGIDSWDEKGRIEINENENSRIWQEQRQKIWQR